MEGCLRPAFLGMTALNVAMPRAATFGLQEFRRIGQAMIVL
jgi:hypothetical protein